MIHPYEFGHKEYKRTCLWLKNLPCTQSYRQMIYFVRDIKNLPPKWEKQKT